MTIETILIHFLFAILLFILINWIGRHSYSVGYVEISLFVNEEEAPAFNFLIRVLSPVIYLIIISSILYSFGLDRFVKNIYIVSIWYIFIRLFFNIATQRSLLINWYKQVIYWISIITLSYLCYEKLIKVKANLLPDFTTVANELWVIVILFLFQLANGVKLSKKGPTRRKENYLISRYKYFKNEYGHIIRGITKHQILEAIAYAVLIYEDFNRPKIIRLIENLKFTLTRKPHTLGVMQVLTNKKISDEESVRLGTLKIKEKYENLLKEQGAENYSSTMIYISVINDYNGGEKYEEEVIKLTEEILKHFYSESKIQYDKKASQQIKIPFKTTSDF